MTSTMVAGFSGRRRRQLDIDSVDLRLIHFMKYQMMTKLSTQTEFYSAEMLSPFSYFSWAAAQAHGTMSTSEDSGHRCYAVVPSASWPQAPDAWLHRPSSSSLSCRACPRMALMCQLSSSVSGTPCEDAIVVMSLGTDGIRTTSTMVAGFPRGGGGGSTLRVT
jgi:hypothetical protein